MPTMRHIWMPLTAVLLVLFGIGGLVVIALRAPGTLAPATVYSGSNTPLNEGPYTTPDTRGPRGRTVPRYSAPNASPGESIFLDGIGTDGQPIPRTASGPGMMGGGCVSCHGTDGSGGRFSMGMGDFEAPDIRYTTLTSKHEGEPAMTDAEIKKAIVEGVEPDGEMLSPYMPRWDMTSADLDATLEYLKELSTP